MKYAWGLFPYKTIDYKAAQAWLEERGERGLRLAGIHGNWLARFTQEDAPVSYFVDLDGGEGEDYLSLCADAGWKHVGTVRRMLLFESRPGARPAPIQTDPEMEERRFGRKYLLRSLLESLAAVLLLAAMIGFMALLQLAGQPGRPQWTAFFLVNSTLAVGLMFLTLLLAALWDVPATLIYWRRSRRAVARGREMPVPDPFWSRARGMTELLPALLGALCFVCITAELITGLVSLQQNYEQEPENMTRSEYRAYPVLMAEDMGLAEGYSVNLQMNGSLLVPEFLQYSELSDTEGGIQYLLTRRYQCRWEWTARLLLLAVRGETEHGLMIPFARDLTFSPAEPGVDEALSAPGGTLLILRQGNTVVFVTGGGADLTAPDIFRLVRERLQLED